MSAGRPVVVYVCIHNSGRSVAALHLTRALAGARVDARSAGSRPGAGVNPTIAAVLAERGIRADDHTPTLLTPDVVADADVVVTMGCGESCPVLPGRRYEDWALQDPQGQDLPTVRGIVEEVERHVRRLLAELGVEVDGGGPGGG